MVVSRHLMNNTAVLNGLRNRWWLVVLLIAVGATLAAVPSPDQVGNESEAARYRATHTMLLNDPTLVQTGAADTRVTVSAEQPDGTSSGWTDSGGSVALYLASSVSSRSTCA